LKVGAAYNKTYFSESVEQTLFPGGSTTYWIVGAEGTWRFVEYGAVWARERNGDLVFTPDQLGMFLPGASLLQTTFPNAGI
jgi:hypothetical protein